MQILSHRKQAAELRNACLMLRDSVTILLTVSGQSCYIMLVVDVLNLCES